MPESRPSSSVNDDNDSRRPVESVIERRRPRSVSVWSATFRSIASRRSMHLSQRWIPGSAPKCFICFRRFPQEEHFRRFALLFLSDRRPISAGTLDPLADPRSTPCLARLLHPFPSCPVRSTPDASPICRILLRGDKGGVEQRHTGRPTFPTRGSSQPASGAAYTRRPSANVCSTRAEAISSTGIANRSRSITARSAAFPISNEPVSPSR